MFHQEGQDVHKSNSGWQPVYVAENLAVMSIGFLLPSADDAVIWRGPRKNGLIKQFLKDTEWGALDYLVVDAPPGTSDEHLSVVQYLKRAGVDGALIVTTPQEVAMADVRKELSFCKKVGMRVPGRVENMSGLAAAVSARTSDVGRRVPTFRAGTHADAAAADDDAEALGAKIRAVIEAHCAETGADPNTARLEVDAAAARRRGEDVRRSRRAVPRAGAPRSRHRGGGGTRRVSSTTRTRRTRGRAGRAPRTPRCARWWTACAPPSERRRSSREGTFLFSRRRDEEIAKTRVRA